MRPLGHWTFPAPGIIGAVSTREASSPLPGGASDVMTEWRLTSGWAPRGEAVTLISMPY